jgi:hypothetical protein
MLSKNTNYIKLKKQLSQLTVRYRDCFVPRNDVLLLFFLLLTLTSFQTATTLNGTWEYRGGKFNDKVDGAPKGYKQQRKYTDTKFEAFLYEKGQKTVKYETGIYTLKTDTCFETQTYSLQPSKLTGVTINYHYTIRNDTLILKAKLPNGAVEEDYWKKVK